MHDQALLEIGEVRENKSVNHAAWTIGRDSVVVRL